MFLPSLIYRAVRVTCGHLMGEFSNKKFTLKDISVNIAMTSLMNIYCSYSTNVVDSVAKVKIFSLDPEVTKSPKPMEWRGEQKLLLI